MMWQFGHKSEVVMQNFVNGVGKGLRYLKTIAFRLEKIENDRYNRGGIFSSLR